MSTTTEQPPRPSDSPAQPRAKRRVLPIVFGSLAALVAVVLLALGGMGVWALTQRDDDGYFTSHTHSLSTGTFALSTSTIDLGGAPGWFADGAGTVRISASSAEPIFLGIGRAGDVAGYLARVPHTQITDFDADPFKVSSHIVPGSARPVPPASQSLWHAQASGSGMQTVSWKVESGKWSAVAMNADGTRHVAVAFQVGARVPALQWVAIGLLIAGALLGALAGWLLYLGLRGRPA